MKKMLIAGNWKMNTNAFESAKLAEYILGGLLKKKIDSGILVCPPFTSIATVSEIVKGSIIRLGAQNCHRELSGAYTGAVSIPMLRYLGVTRIILGHSERRQFFGETDDGVNVKAKLCLERDIKPIICIGETLEERKAEKTFQVLETQIRGCFKGILPENSENIIIAYEPVWAIGTGLAATPDQAQEAHAFIRELLDELGYNAKEMIILYGGSMSDKNARELLCKKDVNGGLIGGASLDPEKFLKIIETAQEYI